MNSVRTVALWLALLGLPLLAGCAATDVETTYGRGRGRARGSVNGTSVLAEMFRQAGHRVSTWNRLSPRLDRSQVIVWTPDSFELPSSDEIKFLEKWLSADGPRTLIYVGRDYDAAIKYWRDVAAQSQGAAYIESRRRLARVEADHAYMRSLTARPLDCSWFSLASASSLLEVAPNDGAWLKDIDPEATQIATAGRLQAPTSARPLDFERTTLLDSPEGPLVQRLTSRNWGPDRQIIVLINGSFVLNLPLVNHQHRQLAGELIAACPPGQVTFLESGPQGLPISTDDPNAHTGFEAFTVWPLSSILLHLTFAGILYCTMIYPIFGKPRETADDTPGNFGKHVRALGELLAHVQDRPAALERVRQYRQLTTDAAAAHDSLPGGAPLPSPSETRHA